MGVLLMNSRTMIMIGLPMIAVTYGLARFSYGLVLPYLRDSLNISLSVAGLIASSAYLAYIISITLAMVYMQKVGPRRMILIAGSTAIVGMAIVSMANNGITLAIGIFIAGLSSGFASPPYAEAVKKWIAENKQSQTNTWVNSGTALGTAITGIVVIFLASDWRMTFILFTVLAIIVMMLNYKYIPKEKVTNVNNKAQKIRVKKSELIEATPLLLASTLLGVAMAGYWTFSRDLVGGMAGVPEVIVQGFWIIIGLAGLVGGFAGSISTKIGLTSSYWLGVIVIGAASLLLGLFSSAIPIVLSAIAFGSSYIFVCGILILWGIGIFKEDPSIGVGVTYLLLTIGQLIGAAFGGMVAQAYSYETMFVIFGLLTLAALIFRPKKTIQSTVTEEQLVSAEEQMASSVE